MTISPPTPSDQELYDLAERFLDALLSSADVDTIGVAQWWERAKTALETGAAASTSWPQCVAKAAKKLQIESMSEASSRVIADLSSVLTDPATFARWRALVQRDAIYVAALVRDRRAARRAKTRPEAVPAEGGMF